MSLNHQHEFSVPALAFPPHEFATDVYNTVTGGNLMAQISRRSMPTRRKP